MRIRSLHLQHFRNIASAHLETGFEAVFIRGSNGQGKTNTLEALGLIAALRSFRSTNQRALIAWGATESRVRVEIDHDIQGETEVCMTLRPGSKSVTVDGEPVERLTGFLGLFPVVAFSSQDLQILRGPPQGRRQFMDLSFSMVDNAYLDALRRYHGALRERNRLLKDRAAPSLLAAFEEVLVPAGELLMRKRKEGLAHFAEVLGRAYGQISPLEELPELTYRPDVLASQEGGFAEALTAALERDRAMGTTSVGPHRDDFQLNLFERGARDYGSEGQQRGLVLALRLAQTHWLGAHTGIRPVILADDILGELDPVRRERFWLALPQDLQVFGTGTALPEGGLRGEWAIYSVDGGVFTRGDDMIFE